MSLLRSGSALAKVRLHMVRTDIEDVCGHGIHYGVPVELCDGWERYTRKGSLVQGCGDFFGRTT